MADIFLYAIIVVLIVLVVLAARRLYFPTVVLFYRPTCPACTGLLPEWNKFKSSLWLTNVKEVNCDDKSNAVLANNFSITTVPNIWIVYPNGSRYQYLTEGPRTADSIAAFVNAPRT